MGRDRITKIKSARGQENLVNWPIEDLLEAVRERQGHQDRDALRQHIRWRLRHDSRRLPRDLGSVDPLAPTGVPFLVVPVVVRGPGLVAFVTLEARKESSPGPHSELERVAHNLLKHPDLTCLANSSLRTSFRVPSGRTADGDSVGLAVLMAALLHRFPSFGTSVEAVATGSWNSEKGSFEPVPQDTLAAKLLAGAQAGYRRVFLIEGQETPGEPWEVVNVPRSPREAVEAILYVLANENLPSPDSISLGEARLLLDFLHAHGSLDEIRAKLRKKLATRALNHWGAACIDEKARTRIRGCLRKSIRSEEVCPGVWEQLIEYALDEGVPGSDSGPGRCRGLYLAIQVCRLLDSRTGGTGAQARLRELLERRWGITPEPRADLRCLLRGAKLPGKKGGSFSLGRYPVTNADFDAFRPRPKCTWLQRLLLRGHDGDLPVTGVDWFEAACFAWWCGGDLPDREEWRAAFDACAAHSDPEHPKVNWGRKWIPTPVNVADSERGLSDGKCRDMLGNVYELCRDGPPERETSKWMAGGAYDTFHYQDHLKYLFAEQDLGAQRGNVGFRCAFRKLAASPAAG